ncbi:MAG TPA: hypothetical protein PLD62_06860 [Candidatus Cloacimonadota bacterium]|nr:hypothetical protein [Candidatus Cloacimonadota bacterium]
MSFMKNKLNLLVLMSLLILSCNSNLFQSVDDIWNGRVYTIPELFDNEQAEDGESYLVEGYIYEYNYSIEYEDFFLFPEQIYNRNKTYSMIDVTVVNHIDSIFSKIIEAFENTDEHWIKVTIRAKAKEVTIYGNGWSDDIFVLEADALKVDD